jgi:hypothetical protein
LVATIRKARASATCNDAPACSASGAADDGLVEIKLFGLAAESTIPVGF